MFDCDSWCIHSASVVQWSQHTKVKPAIFKFACSSALHENKTIYDCAPKQTAVKLNKVHVPKWCFDGSQGGWRGYISSTGDGVLRDGWADYHHLAHLLNVRKWDKMAAWLIAARGRGVSMNSGDKQSVQKSKQHIFFSPSRPCEVSPWKRAKRLELNVVVCGGMMTEKLLLHDGKKKNLIKMKMICKDHDRFILIIRTVCWTAGRVT